MDEGLQEIDGEDVAHSVAYALKRDRKALQQLQPRDDEGHFRAARRIIDQLKLSGFRFFRRPTDWSSRYPAPGNPEPGEDGGD